MLMMERTIPSDPEICLLGKITLLSRFDYKEMYTFAVTFELVPI